MKDFNTFLCPGHYIYIESSYPRHRYDKARIVSPVITGGKCVEFYYHMKGFGIGELNVYQKTAGHPRTFLWQRYGEQSAVWTRAQVPVGGLKKISG